MFEQRLTRLQAELQKQGVNCLMLIPGVSLRYLTGLEFHLMERATIGFFPAKGQPVFVLPGLERSRFENHAPYQAAIFTYEDGEGPADAVRQAVMALPEIQTYAVEHLSMRVFELDLIRRHVPTARMENGDPIIDTLRLIKDSSEIEKMQQAIMISQEALADLLPQIKPGMTEHEIASLLTIRLLEKGGEIMPFAPLVQSGANAADPHGGPGRRKIQSGDVLLIDFGTTHEGYASDITRTFVVGKPSDKLREVYEVVKAANAAGRAAAGPGIPAQEVDRATRDVIEKAGYGEYFTHRTGHGLGMGAHEAPSVDKNNTTPLEPGNVFTVEPGIYIPGEFGIRIEDNILITPTGAQSLTDFPRELKIIGD